jgi:hypothetical protein
MWAIEALPRAGRISETDAAGLSIFSKIMLARTWTLVEAGN